MEKMYNILIVDNNLQVIKTFKEILSNSIHKALYTLTPNEALNLIKNNEIDIIICDQILPEISSVELFKVTKKLYPKSVRVLMGGCSDINTIISAINDELLHYYIPKPLVNDEVIKIFEKAIDFRNDLEEKEKIYTHYKELTGKDVTSQDKLLQKSISKPITNRRQYFRISTFVPICSRMKIIEIKGKCIDSPDSDICVMDIGPGGLKFLSQLNLPINLKIILEFEMDLLGNKVALPGYVVRAKKVEGVLYEYGVKFTINETVREEVIRLLNIIEMNMKKHLTLQGCSLCKKENHIKCLKSRIDKSLKAYSLQK